MDFCRQRTTNGHKGATNKNTPFPHHTQQHWDPAQTIDTFRPVVPTLGAQTSTDWWINWYQDAQEIFISVIFITRV